ncbi:MAG: hypothetical protein ACOX21_00495 [Bacillota bacterium]|jgi:hypothetical protein
MTEKKVFYWQSESMPHYLVRDNNGIMEDYKKGRGWAENPDRIDIICGIDPYYKQISEEEAMKIIRKLESQS